MTGQLPNPTPYGIQANKTGMVTFTTPPLGADTAWLVVLNGPLQNAVIVLGGESVTTMSSLSATTAPCSRP